MLTVDGRTYHVGIASLRRLGSVVDRDNSGRTLDGTMKRDIVGTYYNYELTLGPLDGNYAEYDALYETLSEPIESRLVRMPYGQGVKEFQAYVTNLRDELIKVRGGVNYWKGLSVNFIAKAPARRP